MIVGGTVDSTRNVEARTGVGVTSIILWSANVADGGHGGIVWQEVLRQWWKSLVVYAQELPVPRLFVSW